MHPHRVRRARKRRQLLIAQLYPRGHFFLIRILGLKRRRELDPIEWVAIQILLRSLPGIVRCIKGNIHEKRLLPSGRVGNVVDRIVRHDFAPVFSSLPESGQGLISRIPGIGLAFDRAIMIVLVRPGHTRTLMAHDIKNLFRIDLHVPLTREVSAIPRLLHQLRPKHSSFTLCVQGLFDSARVIQTTSGDQHRATRNANRPAPRAHVVGMRKGRAGSHQTIEIGGINVGETKLSNRRKRLIIREEKQDVGLGPGGFSRVQA